MIEEYLSLIHILADKLEVSFASRALSYCDILIKNDLVEAYINQENFDFDNIEYYQMLRAIYDETDYTYVSDTNNYLKMCIRDRYYFLFRSYYYMAVKDNNK